jgi:hypothetical protein
MLCIAEFGRLREPFPYMPRIIKILQNYAEMYHFQHDAEE